MVVTEDDFLKILDLEGVSHSEIDKIGKNDDSPLKYFWGHFKTMPEGNQGEHSLSVFKRSIKLVRRTDVEVSPSDYVMLFYASLLHDLSKSKVVQPQVHQALTDECNLFSHEKSSHGIRSAHYVARKLRDKKVQLYGLGESHIEQLLNIIAFHDTGDMHPCFVCSRELARKELLLCLVFFLADIADGADYRVPATGTMDDTLQNHKTKSRLRVKEISIERNYVVWWVDKLNKAARGAADSENKKISKHRPLLQAFDLPIKITCLEQGKKVQLKEARLQYRDIKASNMCLDVSRMDHTLVLSADTLPELYEKIVRAFHRIPASDILSHSNYFGPLILEVRNVESDEAQNTVIRSEVVEQISDIHRYVRRWLDKKKGAETEFYYGYTHGQRIWRYVYPDNPNDLDPKRNFQDWSGTLDQFDHVVEILKKEGRNARRGYVVIPHPIIDNFKSHFYSSEEVAPSLIAVQFVLEQGNRLSAFALLRSQELSLFFLVNYFEIRELIKRLMKRLSVKFKDTRLGRIVMLTSLAYFAPDTPLLSKPRLCQMDQEALGTYVKKLHLEAGCGDFIELLHDFQRDYIKVDTKWCEHFLAELSDNKQFDKIREGARALKETLDLLEEKRGGKGHSATYRYIRERKKEAVETFIKLMEESG